MTEKEFRKIVFETEMPSSSKKQLLERVNDLETIIKEHLPVYLSFIQLSKRGSLKNGILLKDEQYLEVELTVKLDKNYQHEQTILLNAIENIILINLENVTIARKNNLELEYEDGIKINMLVTTMKSENIMICERLNNDYPLFKNTIRILKYYLIEQKITTISLDELVNLLGYSVNHYLVDYRYEGYIHAFLKGIDDFLQGSFISLSEKYYLDYQKEYSFDKKTEYTIINFENEENLTKDISQVNLNDYRKYRKAVQKLISITDILSSNKEISIDILPKYNSVTKSYNWYYLIENLNLSNSGGDYPENKYSDALYKSFQKVLKVIIDKGLTKSTLLVRCKNQNLLIETEDLSSESKSRLKTIKNIIDENKLKLIFQ